MMTEQCLDERDDLRAKDDGEYRKDAEAHHTSQKHGQQKMQGLHFKNSCRKNKKLEWCGWRKRGGNHQRQEFLLFKAVADSLQARLADPFQEEEFAASASQQVRQQAPYR